VRVALDATPLLGRRTGVGRYVENLVPALLALPDAPDLHLVPFTFRGAKDLPRFPGASYGERRVPARLLQRAWTHLGGPPVEWVAGRCDVFLGTNFVSPPARRARGVVMVHDLAYLHHADTVTAQSLRYRALVPRALARGTLVVTPSEAMAEQVRAEYSLPPDRVLATPLGVDPVWFDSAPGPSEAPYLLFVGTREPRKDLPVLLAAHALLREQEPGTPDLVLAGPAGWRAEESPPPGVRLAGYLENEALRPLVAGAACLVQPSRYEGFGLPVLEALAAGTPVVSTDVPALVEVGGELVPRVPVGDAVALAEAIRAVLRTPQSAELREQRRRHAAQWSWARCAERTMMALRAA
jgi:glycosyltransferase involved in cell wall biosynthesis